MISVQILINGKVVYCRSAVNISPKGVNGKEANAYQVDTGETIFHTPDRGAIVLSKKMLDTIHETGAK